jgi:hypothetical protein
MAETVWYREVLKALGQEVPRYLTVGGVSVPFSVRTPEKEFKIEVYPSVTATPLYETLALKRQRLELVRVEGSEDTVSNTVLYEEPALPFDLVIQLDFWARFQEDLDTMTTLWYARHYRHFNLDVVDSGGNSRSIFVVQSPIKRAHYTEKISQDFDEFERTFQGSFTLKCWVEIDNNIQTTLPLAKQVGIINNEG